MKENQSTGRSFCAVVPAAGRASRLGADVPKVFVSLLSSFTIWDAIRNRVLPLTERIVLILSPQGRDFIEANRSHFAADSFAKTEIALQQQPLGMGDAIFGAADSWREFDILLIVWGDQFNLSSATLQACIDLHQAQRKPMLTLPVVRAPKPYVEYIFDVAGRLTAVRQSREGDRCAPDGLSDMGVFFLTGGEPLIEAWKHYRSANSLGAATGEINFLPFLVYLSLNAGWAVSHYESSDVSEALGINTKEDLASARKLLQERLTSSGDPP